MTRIKVLAVNAYPIASRTPIGYVTDHIFSRDHFSMLEYYSADCERYDINASEAYRIKIKIKDVEVFPDQQVQEVVVSNNRNYEGSSTGSVKKALKGIVKAIMPLRLSNQIISKIQSFCPDIIYTQGYDIRLLKIALLFSSVTGARIITHTFDNWFSDIPSVLHLEKKYFIRCLASSAVHLAVSPSCQRLLLDNYKTKSIMVANCIRYEDKCTSEEKQENNVITIGYMGNLTPLRYQTINMLANEIDKQSKNEQIKIHLFVPEEHIQTYRDQLNSNIDIHKYVLPDQVEAVYQSFDFLLHAESFSKTVRSFIQYSLSTKIAEILASRRPVVYLGPMDVGVAEFLKDNRVGIYSDRPDEILNSIFEAYHDREKYKNLVNTGFSVGRDFFDCRAVQERLINVIMAEQRDAYE